jgi:hypothetical protein
MPFSFLKSGLATILALVTAPLVATYGTLADNFSGRELAQEIGAELRTRAARVRRRKARRARQSSSASSATTTTTTTTTTRPPSGPAAPSRISKSPPRSSGRLARAPSSLLHQSHKESSCTAYCGCSTCLVDKEIRSQAIMRPDPPRRRLWARLPSPAAYAAAPRVAPPPPAVKPAPPPEPVVDPVVEETKRRERATAYQAKIFAIVRESEVDKEKQRRDRAAAPRHHLQQHLVRAAKADCLARLHDVGRRLDLILDQMAAAWDAGDQASFAQLAAAAAGELGAAQGLLGGMPLSRFDVFCLEWPLERLWEVARVLRDSPSVPNEVAPQLRDFVLGWEACEGVIAQALVPVV